VSRNREKRRFNVQIWKNKAAIVDAFNRINLKEKKNDEIVQKLKQWDIWMEEPKTR